MHIRRGADLRGARRRRSKDFPRSRPRPPTAIWCRATGKKASPRRPSEDRPAAMGRRPDLQPRVTTFATPALSGSRLRAAAAASGRRGSPPSNSTAPSRCGRCGSWRGSRVTAFGLISKTHHSLVDGGLRKSIWRRSCFDRRGGPRRPTARRPSRRGQAGNRSPRPAELVVAGVSRGMVKTDGRAGRAGRSRPPIRPGTSLKSCPGTRSEGLGEIMWGGASNPAPETPLNLEIGPHRPPTRWCAQQLARLQARQGHARRDRPTTSC